MPIENLLSPSPLIVFGFGLLSSVFDNNSLTALALEQGGYDWPLLAYAVGFGFPALVRLFRRGGAHRFISERPVGASMATARLVSLPRVCHRVLW